MSDTALPQTRLLHASERPAMRDASVERRAPPPPHSGPVLLSDCVTPVGGETLLSLLWRRWDTRAAKTVLDKGPSRS
ncbi:hypothetical protein [Cognatishimia sp. F0-27]|uniref:hypothetical protein n=1 Tax=Cognatishimia sp. F0-27 TaxID=2816855 RepID=UPI001D0C125E|nr:hypothetical protein [Cognatishimia sp. F0-27]MCC1491068.1 hypothetical protein [Cognatishimia sp. F0-27]